MDVTPSGTGAIRCSGYAQCSQDTSQKERCNVTPVDFDSLNRSEIVIAEPQMVAFLGESDVIASCLVIDKSRKTCENLALFVTATQFAKQNGLAQNIPFLPFTSMRFCQQ